MKWDEKSVVAFVVAKKKLGDFAANAGADDADDDIGNAALQRVSSHDLATDQLARALLLCR